MIIMVIGLVFGCYADELKVGDCVSVLCCAEVRCAHCALWWMQLREGGAWRRLPTAGAPPPSTQSVLSEAPDWGHQQGDHHPSLMCYVLYSCKIFWRSINKVFSFQIQYILYSPIMMIKYISLSLLQFHMTSCLWNVHITVCQQIFQIDVSMNEASFYRWKII